MSHGSKSWQVQGDFNYHVMPGNMRTRHLPAAGHPALAAALPAQSEDPLEQAAI
jgi:hypothetical protein